MTETTPLQKSSQDRNLRFSRKKLIPLKFSWEEVNERRENGLCIFCEEQETPDHHRKHKNVCLVMIEDEIDPNFDDDQVLEIEAAIQKIDETTAVRDGKTNQNKLRLLQESQDVESESVEESMYIEEISDSLQNDVSQEANKSTMVTGVIPPSQVAFSILEPSLSCNNNSRFVLEALPYIFTRSKLSLSGFECITGKINARQMFDTLTMREQKLQQMRKWITPFKTWKFRFKDSLEKGYEWGLSSSISALVDELIFFVADSHGKETKQQYVRELLGRAQRRHKILTAESMIKAFYEVEEALEVQLFDRMLNRKTNSPQKTWKFKFKISLEGDSYCERKWSWSTIHHIAATRSRLVQPMQQDDQDKTVKALTNKLQIIAGQHLDVLENLTLIVIEYVDFLREIRNQYYRGVAEYFEKISDEDKGAFKNLKDIKWSRVEEQKGCEAFGFSYINDIVFSILQLLMQHECVLYVDIQQVNGKEEATCAIDRFKTISFHKFEDSLHGASHIQEIGYGHKKHYSLNVPLNDERYLLLFKPIMSERIEFFKSGVWVLQDSDDSLFGIVVGCVNLSFRGHAAWYLEIFLTHQILKKKLTSNSLVVGLSTVLEFWKTIILKKETFGKNWWFKYRHRGITAFEFHHAKFLCTVQGWKITVAKKEKMGKDWWFKYRSVNFHTTNWDAIADMDSTSVMDNFFALVGETSVIDRELLMWARKFRELLKEVVGVIILLKKNKLCKDWCFKYKSMESYTTESCGQDSLGREDVIQEIIEEATMTWQHEKELVAMSLDDK